MVKINRRKLLASASAISLLAGLPQWTHGIGITFPSGAVGLWNFDQATTTAGGVPYVPNTGSSATGTAASSSYIYASRRLFASLYNVSGGTAVDNNATGPDSLTEATTLTMSSGSWFVSAYDLSNHEGIYLPAGTYTIAVNAQRGTGSNQTFKFMVAGSTGSGSAQTATSSWQRFSMTFTQATSGTTTLGIANNGSAAATLNICDLEVFAGSSDLGPVAKAGHLYLGGCPNTAPTVTGAMADFSGGAGGLIQFNNAASNISLSTFTVSILIDAVNYPSQSGGTTILCDATGSSPFALYTAYNTNTFVCPAIGFSSQNTASVAGWANMKGAGPHVITYMWDGTAYQVYWDDTRINYTLPGSNPSVPITVSDLMVEVFPGFLPASTDKIGAIAMWNSALTQQQIYNVVDSWSSRYSPHFNMALQQTYVFAEGDSITQGVGTTYSYPYYVNALGSSATFPGTNFPTVPPIGFNFAIAGSTVGPTPDDVGNSIEAHLRLPYVTGGLPPASRRTGRTFAMSVFFGANDGLELADADDTGATFLNTYYIPYINSLMAAGYGPIIAGTIVDRQDTDAGAVPDFFTWRTNVNSTITSSWPHASAVMDFAGNANLGADDAANNSTYFNTDKVHPTTLSQETIMAPLYLAALNSVL